MPTVVLKGIGGLWRWGRRDFVPAVVYRITARGQTWLTRFERQLPGDWRPRPERLSEEMGR